MPEFNQKQYIQEYKNKYKKKISIDLNKEEAEELNKMCTEKKITKVQVLRKGIEWLRKQ